MTESNENSGKSDRLEVLKTYKMYIDGKFPRTESARYYQPVVNGTSLGNVCLASRKDVRNSVVAARSAQAGWARRTAYNRAQILYRIAEMLEGRSQQFLDELTRQGVESESAETQITQSIDRLIYYAGWCDKYQQVFSSVNPVASSHFNFSTLEPVGVVFAVASRDCPLLGLISLIAPVIASGNTCVVLASENSPLSAITFAEVLATSDVPGGVVNILTGRVEELSEHFSRHLDVNAIACDGLGVDLNTTIKEFASETIKRVKIYNQEWSAEATANPYLIQDFCEVKTTWHPIEQITESGASY
ncbi:aldehyde dehydrogenase family protein [Mariniblastus sp.]|nr:aldehyde dehydrogenase family protein [bacterium]MDC0283731.1 aldehyde dehydrogenase family protein [Mariniblastus sp.]MDC3255890.1 aldehyde dehydrogenase family protein [bacterium]